MLLVRLRCRDWTGWVLPGGGKEPDEDDHTALRRELAEETGVPEVFIGPLLWRRRIINPRLSEDWDGQDEMVYLTPCHHFEIAPTMTAEELANEGLVEHRWWTVPELEAADDDLRPPELPGLVRRILERGAPPEPDLIEEVV